MSGKTIRSIFLFVFFSMFLATHCHSAAGPRLVIEEKTHDAGVILQGGIIEHSFTVFNKGDEILSINKVRPG